MRKEKRVEETYSNIDQGNAGPIVRVRLRVVHKGVLAPVSNHQGDAKHQEGDDEDHERGPRVEPVQGIVGQVGRPLPEGSPGGQGVAFGTDEIQG